MIFVTVGAQMAFDRLVGAVDAWAGEVGRTDVFAQIGPSRLEPRNLEWTRFLPPPEFRVQLERADLVVAHAGMGSILSALEVPKPILVMPRRGSLRETRNDHQVATAERFRELAGVTVAMNEAELALRLAGAAELRAGPALSRVAPPPLVGALRRFIAESPSRRGS